MPLIRPKEVGLSIELNVTLWLLADEIDHPEQRPVLGWERSLSPRKRTLRFSHPILVIVEVILRVPMGPKFRRGGWGAFEGRKVAPMCHWQPAQLDQNEGGAHPHRDRHQSYSAHFHL